MRSIILLGAPGAGKGTVASGLAERTDYQHVSTGDILRVAVKDGTPLGLKAKEYMDRGDLVPDDVIVDLIKERLASGQPDDAYMFDGFPRTLNQARLFEEVLEKIGGVLQFVFLLEVPEEVLIQRLTGRRVCRSCGAVYHVKNIPPKKEGVCDLCGGELYQRPDDSEETVRNRLSVYREQTADLIGHYEEMDVLKRIEANRGPEQTESAVVEYLQDLEFGER